MKTLIIHPEDESTSFLDIVYKPIPQKTVVTGGLTRPELLDLIESHDRIMMMGHGSPNGLFSVGQFRSTNNGFVIDKSFVDILHTKKDCVYIWCNADVFVKNNKLRGFYSGMFISEVGEAYICGLHGINQKIVDESNFSFCNIISKCINRDTKSIYDSVKLEYGLLAEGNPVALYNNNRLYMS